MPSVFSSFLRNLTEKKIPYYDHIKAAKEKVGSLGASICLGSPYSNNRQADAYGGRGREKKAGNDDKDDRSVWR